MGTRPKIKIQPERFDKVIEATSWILMTSNAMVQLFSPDGRLIATEEMRARKTSINNANLQSGLYFLWYDDGSRKQRFKILKL